MIASTNECKERERENTKNKESKTKGERIKRGVEKKI